MDFFQQLIFNEQNQESKDNFYKEFIERMRKKSLEDTYIVIDTDTSTKLNSFIKMLDDIDFKEGSYHICYGRLKHIINSFILYWTETIDGVIKITDEFSNVISKDELLHLLEQTISMHQKRQIDFGNQYLPVQSQSQKNTYEEIEEKYQDFMNRLNEMKTKVEGLNRQDSIMNFAKEQFPYSVKKKCEVFVITHTYIALKLATNLHEIRVSLEEILKRVKNNLKELQGDREQSLNKMLQQLYERNKELLHTNRKARGSSVTLFELKHTIDKIRKKIESYLNDMPLRSLKEEVQYWEITLAEFNKIATTLNKLRTEHENISQEEQKWSSYRTTELPGHKRKAWENMGENIKRRKAYINEKYINAAKSLVTYFSVRGPNRMVYADNTGPYYVDMYGHQVYFLESGLKSYHVSCDGAFKQSKDDTPYFFDTNGRYILDDNGEKVYQVAPCCSTYKLGEDTLLKKISEDCGHSEKANINCRMEIRDPNDVEILPTTQKVDIKSSLNPEVVKYLWDNFGCILPDALNDVTQLQPKNPIHYLAHRILYHKYSRTINELSLKKKEAEDYRAEILQDRKDKAAEEYRRWKVKQVKRRKPEESDDTQERSVYAAQVAAYDFINSINYYD